MYHIAYDYGYSNYTVEGTTVNCAKSLNPDMPFDRWYGEDKRDLFAETCVSYIHGGGVEIDCDREMEVKSDDPEIKWAAFVNGYVTGAVIERIM